MSHILTKKDLTIYLAEHRVDVLNKVGKQSDVFFDRKCITNIPHYPKKLLQHNQEEANTLILFQAKNVTDLDPFTDLYVVSPNADVLLLLITTLNYVQAQRFEQAVATIYVISKFAKCLYQLDWSITCKVYTWVSRLYRVRSDWSLLWKIKIRTLSFIHWLSPRKT